MRSATELQGTANRLLFERAIPFGTGLKARRLNHLHTGSIHWRTGTDLNRHLRDRQSRALPIVLPVQYLFIWWSQSDSNAYPLHAKQVLYLIELWPLHWWMWMESNHQAIGYRVTAGKAHHTAQHIRKNWLAGSDSNRHATP